jgi:hypothetical protein
MMKIDKIREELYTLNLPPPDTLQESPEVTEKLSQFNKVSEEKITKFLSKSPNKQCGSDPIPTWLVKECADCLVPSITKMVNLSLQLGYFPSDWKNALVTPLLKKPGADLVFSNFRPVSNLQFMSKLAERASVDQLTKHIEKNQPLPTHQSAYRPFHSAETALLKVQNDILLNMDKQKVTLLVMLDLSAAFDTIDHKIMLQTLQNNFGVTDVALRWYASYLEGRTQQMQVLGQTSAKSTLQYGVPQGSCLGPILFTVYAASLFKVIEHYLPHAHGYADDHQLYTAFTPSALEQEKNIKIMETCIREVRKWMARNKLKINDKKTEFLIIGSRQQLQKLSIKGVHVGQDLITPVKKVRNLGVIFDENMTMEKHIAKVCSTAFYHLHNIRSIRRYLSQEAACTLIHAFVGSQMDYCNSLLGGLPSCQVKKLQRAQNAAVRLVLNLQKYDHITPGFIQLHWLPIRLRIKFKILLLVFKALHGMAPKYIADLVVMATCERYGLRSNSAICLRVPRFKCVSFGKRAFATHGPALWNELPLELRKTERIDDFKKRTKTFLFNDFLKNGF